MSTLTIELDPGLAHCLEDVARREKKPVSIWAREQLARAALEETSEQNGYPDGWLKLFGSLSDDLTFEAPARGESRPMTALSLE